MFGQEKLECSIDAFQRDLSRRAVSVSDELVCDLSKFLDPFETVGDSMGFELLV